MSGVQGESTTGQVFDRGAAQYDRARRQLIPCFDEFYGTVLDLLPGVTAPRVLDLGAGTGLLSTMIAGRFPGAELLLYDASTAMLAQARDRFSAWPGRVTCVAGDYLETALPADVDIAVSALSIHHLDDAGKRRLYGRIFDCLSEGGVFINADQVLGASPAVERHYRRNWLNRVQASGIGETDLAAARERMKADRMTPLSLQLTWLKACGFEEVECWYMNFSFAVFSGRKPGNGKSQEADALTL